MYINYPGHMTKMAAIAINRNFFKNLLQNQKAYDFETCHEASGRGALEELYKVYINHGPGMTFATHEI